MRTIIEFNIQTGVRTERPMTDEEVAVIPVPSLEDLQSEKWQQIKIERDRRKAGGVKVNGKWFHTDQDSRIQQLGLKLFGVYVPPVMWKTMDGTFVEMTETLADSIFRAVAELDIEIFANAEVHRKALKASADPANYDYSAGWPVIFGDN